jgi:PAS domain-containing protein
MASQFVPAPALPRAKGRLPLVLLGLGLALIGIVVVEVLIALSMHPLTPIGWPSLGMIAASALGGVAGCVGGALGVIAYYLVNLAYPERFPIFFASASNTVTWCIAVGFLTGGALLVRPRLLRLTSAEAELIARRQYETALLESEERARVAKERLEMALDGSNVVLWDTDLRTKRVYLSEAWSRMVGREEDGETVTTVADLLAMLHPDDVEAVRRPRSRC